MPTAEKLENKSKYFEKLIDLCVNYPTALIVQVDHVGSKQMQEIRMDLRGKAVVLMGKNSMIRKALQVGHERHPDAGMDKLRAIVQGNIGFIFQTNCTVDDIRASLKKWRVRAAAKAGQVSLCNEVIPSGPTGMDPSKTNIFQMLNIGTKIVKGQIELTTEFQILKQGEKVSASQQTLLSMLGLKPFEYGMEVLMVYQDYSVFDAAVLDIKDDVLICKFMQGIANVAAFGRELGIPTEAGLPHMFGNAFKTVAALVGDIDFSFPEVEETKKFLENPEAYKAANPVAAAPATGGSAAPAAAKKAEKAPVEEEEEEDMEFDLFG